MKRRVQRPRDCGRRYDGGHRETVPDTLGHRHDIRRDAVRLKIPKALAGSAETRLHFVGYAQAAIAPDQLVHPFQIAFRELNDSSDTLYGGGNYNDTSRSTVRMNCRPYVGRKLIGLIFYARGGTAKSVRGQTRPK